MDALKRAALEKQKRDAMLGSGNAHYGATNHEPPAVQNTEEISSDSEAHQFDQSNDVIPATHGAGHDVESNQPPATPEELDGEKLSLDVDFDELARSNQDLENREGSPKGRSEIVVSDEVDSLLAEDGARPRVVDDTDGEVPSPHIDAAIDNNKVINSTTSNINERDNATVDQQAGVVDDDTTEPLELSANTAVDEVVSAPALSPLHHSPIDSSASDKAVPNAAANAFADEILAQMEGESDATNSTQKLSFQRLLEHNRAQLRKKKRLFIVLFSTVTVLAVALIALYFFYVNYQSSDFRPLPNVSPYTSTSVLPSDEEEAVDQFDESLAVQEETDDGKQGPVEIGDAVENETLPNETDLADVQTTVPQQITKKIAPENVTKNPPQTPAEPAPAIATSADANASEARNTTLQPIDSNRQSVATTPADNSAKPQWQVQSRSTTIDDFSVTINRGFAAYQRGDWTTAQQAYAEAMRLRPQHRDAILGSAAVAVAQGQYQVAFNLYQQRLVAAPNDNFAQAGIISIVSMHDASPDLLSRVNTLLQEYPNAAHLHFLKGSLFARQQQWAAAQAAFFRAWSYHNDRGDYAYNLAISLDHIHQPEEALRYYRLALERANNSVAVIDIDRLKKRIQQLEARRE